MTVTLTSVLLGYALLTQPQPQSERHNGVFVGSKFITQREEEAAVGQANRDMALARSLVARGQREKAETILEQGLAGDQTSDVLLGPLAELYLMDDNPGAAYRLLRPKYDVEAQGARCLTFCVAAAEDGKPTGWQNRHCEESVRELTGDLFDPGSMPRAGTRRYAEEIALLAAGVQLSKFAVEQLQAQFLLSRFVSAVPRSALGRYYLACVDSRLGQIDKSTSQCKLGLPFAEGKLRERLLLLMSAPKS